MYALIENTVKLFIISSFHSFKKCQILMKVYLDKVNKVLSFSPLVLKYSIVRLYSHG